jgi:hypothetical protein
MLQVLNSSKPAEERYAVILGAVPRSIELALDCPPIQELIHQGVKTNDLEACLAVEIARAANMLTVGGNLRQGQSVEIARMLITDYPGESLQDFCLCLRKGIKGGYGDIYRFDVLVISEWFRKYLEEKYDVVERKLMTEKENDYTSIPDKPVYPLSGFKLVHDQFWVFAFVKNKQARAIIWEQRFVEMARMSDRKPAPLTAKDILLEGQLKRKKDPYPSSTESMKHEKDLHIQYIRDNYDPHTANPKPGWIPESEWRRNLSQVSATGDLPKEISSAPDGEDRPD